VTTATAKSPAIRRRLSPADRLRGRLRAGHNPFWLRRVHSLTGLILGLYIIFHLIVNATLAEGFRAGALQIVYQKQVNSIQSMPFLGLFVFFAVYLPLAFHLLYGIRLIWLGKPNVGTYPFGLNVFYLFQRVSSLIIVAFLAFHVTAMKGWWGAGLKFDPWQATESVSLHMTASWILGWFVYPVGILAACYHTAYGFWTAAITWGLTISAGAQRRWGWICFGLFLAIFACGMMGLMAALTPVATARHG
jgi:succinate dehydrogenase/fumarate reductase cytochrome b subunit